MRYEIIDASQAPPKPGAPPNKRAAIILQIVSQLTPGRVARIVLEGTETPRGTKTSISRASKKLGRQVNVWEASGAMYAELAEERPRRRRGRPPRASISA